MSAPAAANERPVVAIVSTNGLLLPLAFLLVRTGACFRGRSASSPATTRERFQRAWHHCRDPGRLDSTADRFSHDLEGPAFEWRHARPDVGPAAILADSRVRQHRDRRGLPGCRRELEIPFDAGIAVSGDVTALPVHRLSRSAPEWHSIVDAHLNEFEGAQRLSPRLGALPGTALRDWLLRGDVALWKVSRPSGDYFYFEVIDDLTKATKSCPPVTALEGRVDAPSHGPSRLVDVHTVNTSCRDFTEFIEVIGAVTAQGTTRLVIKSSGDDWEEYKIVEPNTSHTWRQF